MGWVMAAASTAVFLVGLLFVDDRVYQLLLFVGTTLVVGFLQWLPVWRGLRGVVPAPPDAVVLEEEPPDVLGATAFEIAFFVGIPVVLAALNVIPWAFLGIPCGIGVGEALAAREMERVKRGGEELLRRKKFQGLLERQYFTTVSAEHQTPPHPV
jgi:hypothetical protein